MEYRIVLTKQEAFDLSKRLQIKGTTFVTDTYTGKERIRLETGREAVIKPYETSVTGIINRYSSSCELGDIKNIWFEYKWTDKTDRFEIEFEGDIPDEFMGRENIRGWHILK